MSMSMRAMREWKARRIPWKVKLNKAGLRTGYFLDKQFIKAMSEQLDHELQHLH